MEKVSMKNDNHHKLLWGIFLFVIICLICKVFDWTSIIYYFILLFISILGSILGINKKKK